MRLRRTITIVGPSPGTVEEVASLVGRRIGLEPTSIDAAADRERPRLLVGAGTTDVPPEPTAAGPVYHLVSATDPVQPTVAVDGGAVRVPTAGRTAEAMADEVLNDAINRGAIGPPGGGVDRRSSSEGGPAPGLIVGAVAVCLVLLVLVGALAAALFLGVRTSEVVLDGDAGPLVLREVPPEAPPGDQYIPVQLVDERGPVVEREIRERLAHAEMVNGTGVHVGRALGPSGLIDLYRWEEIDVIGRTVCEAQAGTSGGSAGCRQVGMDRMNEPSLSWGTSSSEGLDIASVSVADLAAEWEARWLVVETDRELRIVADVVDGMTYAEWPASGGQPLLVLVYDEEHRERYRTRLG